MIEFSFSSDLDVMKRAIEAAVDAALGEVSRQAGIDPQILREARADGIAGAGPFVAELERRRAERLNLSIPLR